MLPGDVAADREPPSEPTVAYGTGDPHAFVETPDMRPQVVLVPVRPRTVGTLHQLN